MKFLAAIAVIVLLAGCNRRCTQDCVANAMNVQIRGFSSIDVDSAVAVALHNGASEHKPYKVYLQTVDTGTKMLQIPNPYGLKEVVVTLLPVGVKHTFSNFVPTGQLTREIYCKDDTRGGKCMYEITHCDIDGVQRGLTLEGYYDVYR